MLALFFGLSFAAVREMRVDCRNQYLMVNASSYLLVGDGGRLLLGGPQQCELVMGDVGVSLPEWAQTVIKLGLGPANNSHPLSRLLLPLRAILAKLVDTF
jgi:hypothetical protein